MQRSMSWLLRHTALWLTVSLTLFFPGWAVASNQGVADCIFNWAEANYPQLFSSPASSDTYDVYYYRFYPATGSFLALQSATEHLLYLGPLSSQQILDLGALSQWQADHGCTGAESISVTPVLDSTMAASASIVASAGGTLSATGSNGSRYTLTVPADALLADTTITMTPIASLADLPVSGGYVAGVVLQPEGLKFQQPVVLTIEPATSLAVARQIGFTFQGAGSDNHMYPLALGQGISLNIWHFTGYTVGDGNSADVASQAAQPAPTSLASYEQGVASLVSQARQGTISNSQMAQGIQSLGNDYLNNVINPEVTRALQSDSVEYIQSVIADVLSFERQMALLGLEGDPNYMNAVTALMNRMRDIVRAAFCADPQNHDLFVQALMVARQYALLGLDAGMPTSAEECSIWVGTTQVTGLDGYFTMNYTAQITFELDTAASTTNTKVYKVRSGSVTATEQAGTMAGVCAVAQTTATYSVAASDGRLTIDVAAGTYQATGFTDPGQVMTQVMTCPEVGAISTPFDPAMVWLWADDRSYPLAQGGTSFSGSRSGHYNVGTGADITNSWSFSKQ